MKLIATLIASAFAVTAFAAEPAKTDKTGTVAAPAPVTSAPAVKKDDKKPVKSVPAKAEDKKAEAPKK